MGLPHAKIFEVLEPDDLTMRWYVQPDNRWGAPPDIWRIVAMRQAQQTSALSVCIATTYSETAARLICDEHNAKIGSQP